MAENEEIKEENKAAQEEPETEQEPEKSGDDKETKQEKAEEQAEEKAEEEPKEEDPQEDDAEEEDLNTRYLRLMADFQNYKRRAEQDRANIHAYANEKIVTPLLEVMDNFERALEADADESFKEGMRMIFEQLRTVLTDAGMEEVKADPGVAFDPNFHNAVMMEQTDAAESGQISQVLQKGYALNGKVIRAAMVKVAE